MSLDQSVIDLVCPRKEQQDEAIRIIQEMREKGFTGKEITDYLKEVGYKSSHNRPFSISYVYFVLKKYHVRRVMVEENEARIMDE